MKMDDAAEILFRDILRKAENKKNNTKEITHFFKIKN